MSSYSIEKYRLDNAHLLFVDPFSVNEANASRAGGEAVLARTAIELNRNIATSHGAFLEETAAQQERKAA